MVHPTRLRQDREDHLSPRFWHPEADAVPWGKTWGRGTADATEAPRRLSLYWASTDMWQIICVVLALALLVSTFYLFHLASKLSTAKSELESLAKKAEASVASEARAIVAEIKSLLSRI